MARRPRRPAAELGALARDEYASDLEEMHASYGHLMTTGPSFADRAAAVRAGAAFEVSGGEIKTSVPAVDLHARYSVSTSDVLTLIDRGRGDDL